MSLKVQVNHNSWTSVPADVYTAKVREIEEIEVEFQGETKPCARFTFEVTAGEFAGESISALANIPPNGIGPKSKLYGWFQTLTGKTLDDTDEVDLESLVGKACRINVVDSINKQGDPATKVKDLLPAPKPRAVSGRSGAAPAAPRREPETEELSF